MADKNIVIAGATFNGVPSIEIPTSGGGSASFVEVSDTTATAADVAQGKYFYTAAGVKTEGTSSGGSAVIQSLSVTENGTYNPPSGVDGYAPVTVNVSGGGGGLPSEYTQVEYVHANANGYTDYINTGVIPDSNTAVVAIAFFNSQYGANSSALFGVRTALQNKSFAYMQGPRDVYWDFGNHRNQFGGSPLYLMERMKRIIFNRNGFSANNDTVSITGDTFTCEYPLFLLAYNNAGSIISYANASLYSCRIYQSGTLAHDYVPCKRNADSVVGLYDLVTNTFLVNSGSGTLIAGPDVN